MSPWLSLIVFIVAFVGLSALFRIPVAFSIGIATLLLYVLNDINLVGFAQVCFSGLDTFTMLAVPFFIFAGSIMEYSGISDRLLQWVETLIGKIRGFTGAVCIVASALFGLLTGSIMSTLSAIGKMMIEKMKQKGYPKEYAAALAAASSFLGILIPPSAPGIAYALASGAKVTDVWMATVAPGILIIILYLIVNYIKCRKFEPVVEREPQPASVAIKRIGKSTWQAFPAMLMPILIYGTIYGGIGTATEAGAVSVAYGILYYGMKKFVLRRPVDKNMKEIALDSSHMMAVVGMLLVFAGLAGRVFTQIGIADAIADLVSHYSNKYVYLLACNVIFLILGMFMDINPSILLMTPLLLPAAQSMGVDPAHFGAIMLVNLCFGNLTPPFAATCFVSSGMAGASFGGVIKQALPFLGVGLIAILFTTYCPEIVMWLPRVLSV